MAARAKVLAENVVSQFKAILDVKLSSRTFENQQVEVAIKCGVLNRMAGLGLTRSERVF